MWKKPWVITQKWEDILFLHWSVQADELKHLIPKELELDLYENKAWLSFVLFKVRGNRLRFTPSMLGVSSFLQLNVRTYVTYNGMKGVYFFHLDANNALIVKMTTIGQFLPYRRANMSLENEDEIFSFVSNFRNANIQEEALKVTFEPMTEQIENIAFDCWLVERYHLWTKMKGRLLRIDTYHSPWCLQKVNVEIHHNTMAPLLKSLTQSHQPIAHYSKSKKARIFVPVVEAEKAPSQK